MCLLFFNRHLVTLMCDKGSGYGNGTLNNKSIKVKDNSIWRKFYSRWMNGEWMVCERSVDSI